MEAGNIHATRTGSAAHTDGECLARNLLSCGMKLESICDQHLAALGDEVLRADEAGIGLDPAAQVA